MRGRSLWILIGVAVLVGLALLFRLSPSMPGFGFDPTSEFPDLAALGPVPEPPDNPVTPEKVELGRHLYFDPRLSGDLAISCASCHHPEAGWGDGGELSTGYPGTQHWRNSQTLINAAYYAKLFWAGESLSLEKQAHSAISGNLAGNGDSIMIEERLAQIPEYVQMFRAAFGAEQPVYDFVLKAIASFERTLIDRDTPFDRFMRGDRKALSAGQVAGLRLFTGKANCVACHSGPLLSDENFHHLGVPDSPLFATSVMHQIALRYQHFSRGVSEEIYRAADGDLGLYYTTKRAKDKGAFRTPSLRYTAYSGPYMHSGVFKTLAEVVDFYDRGGGEDPLKSPLIEPLGLTSQEKADLLDFLGSLSGEPITVEQPAVLHYAVMPAS